MVDFESFSFTSPNSFGDHQESIRLHQPTSKQHAHEFSSDYKKIRVVGKGAFGTAVLYRRQADSKLVVIKQVDVTNMNAYERMLASNEVKVLSILKHPNIVTFYNNFERNGKLFIEMEYCSGGTLSDFLASLSKPLRELEILTIFEQIVSAITYIHDLNILHRDLKTTNIFMTEDKRLKIGDFGISKVLNTHQIGCSTLVGTPHYISPEMFEGKNYDKKTDIWALGCICYEMACLQKTFEGTNLLTLINKIIKGKYDPVKRTFSIRFQKLIGDMLQKNPSLRPHAHEILEEVGELLMKNRLTRYESEMYSNEGSTNAIMLIQQQTRSQMKRWRSILYEVHLTHSNVSLSKVDLPFHDRVKEFAKSCDHFLVLTENCKVFSWGDSNGGKLGLGQCPLDWIAKPKSIEELSGKSVCKIIAGEGFSIFVCRNGLVLSCGSADSGCLGYEVEEDVHTPQIIHELIDYSITQICCGPHHVLVATDSGEVLAWGDNFYGQLGLIDEPSIIKVPKLVKFPEEVFIEKVFTGPDASMFLDSREGLWVCGSNEFNKLGLSGSWFVKKVYFPRIYQPQMVKLWTQQSVHSISLGHQSTLILFKDGLIMILGHTEITRLCNKPSIFQCLKNNRVVKSKICENNVTKVQLAENFIVAQTFENQIYFWGIREVEKHSTKDSKSLHMLNSDDEVVRIGEANKSLMNMVENFGPDYPILLVSDPKVVIEHPRHLALVLPTCDATRKDYILKPQPILALYSSHTNLRFGETIEISNIYCFRDDKFFVILDTTIPPPVRGMAKRQRSRTIHRTASQLPVVLEEASLETLLPPIPERSAELRTSRWEQKVNVRLAWTFPMIEKEANTRHTGETLEKRIKELSAQLEDSQRRVKEYQNLVEELEKKFKRSKRSSQDLNVCSLQ